MTTTAILKVDAFLGESAPPLRLFPDQPDVKLNIAAKVLEVVWVEEQRLAQSGQRANATMGTVSLELPAGSVSEARDHFELLRKQDLPLYVTVMAIPPLPHNSDCGLQIMSAFRAIGSTVSFVFPTDPELTRDFGSTLVIWAVTPPGV